MAGLETTIVHLHVKNLPAKYFAHQPNIFRKKSFFLTVVKTVMLKLSPICQRIDTKYCKIHFYSHSCSMPPFWIGFCCQKSLQASKTLSGYLLLRRHSPQTSGFSKICFRGLGRIFQNKYGVPEANSVRIIKTTSQASYQDKNIAQKY